VIPPLYEAIPIEEQEDVPPLMQSVHVFKRLQNAVVALYLRQLPRPMQRRSLLLQGQRQETRRRYYSETRAQE